MKNSKAFYPKPVLCHVAHALNPGGTERLVCELARAFKDKFEVIVVTLEEPGAWGLSLRAQNIPVYPLFREPGIDLNVIWDMCRIFKRHRVNIVHAHQYSPFFYAGLTKLFYPRVKLIFHEHGRHYPETVKPLKNFFNRLLLAPLANDIVAVSCEVRERLAKYEGLNPQKIKVIYNGIPMPARLAPEERKTLRKEFGFSEDDFIVATVGRFDPIKNLPMLLKAIALARKKNKNIKGLLIGDGPEFSKLKNLAKDLGLENVVLFTGFRKDATRIVQLADVFVLSSFSEGTSLALLEAMACGLPAVVTAVGGNPEIVIDGITGVLVPSEDHVRLAAAFLLLAENPRLCEEMAKASRKRFEENFVFEKMVASFESLYQGLLAPNHLLTGTLKARRC
ncbi:glycosyltransferase [Thermodesulfatator atlanticus]